jgi:hypothetical protein
MSFICITTIKDSRDPWSGVRDARNPDLRIITLAT